MDTTDHRPDHRPGHQRTRSRGLSFRSDKSNGSYKQPKVKIDSLRESAEEKRRNHLSLGTKANPNAAINEAQPVAAALEASTLQSLRDIQHVDTNGQVISEPDLSNPTRSRWERPLDTIRSFDRAIDNEYRRKQSIFRQDMYQDGGNGYASRRSSYYGGPESQYPPSRYSQYGGQPNGGQPNGGPPNGNRNRDSYAEYGQSPMAGPSRNRYSQRVHPDLPLNRYNTAPNGYGPPQPVYPNQGYQQSRDTVSTGPSSGSQSEPWANSSDPSSENSSVERMNVTQKPVAEPGDQYNMGYGAPIHEDGEYAYPPPNRGQQSMNQNGSYFQPNHYDTPPPVPPHKVRPGPPRQAPVKLGGPSPVASAPMPLSQTSGNTRPPMPQQDSKRKSWFKRRFSKN